MNVRLSDKPVAQRRGAHRVTQRRRTAWPSAPTPRGLLRVRPRLALPRRPERIPRQQSPRQPLGAPAAVALTSIGILAAFAVWLVFYGLVLSRLAEQHSQHQLYAKFREQLAAETAPIGGTIRNGTPVAILDIPRAGLHNAVVVEGTLSGNLEKGPGHRIDTVLPGQVGVSVLFGKSVTFGAPFANVTRLRPGDSISVVTGQGRAVYQVISVRHAGDPLPPAPTGGRLTLVTLAGHGWRSGWAPTQTVYVDANLQGTVRAASAAASTQPANQIALAADSAALSPLVLWLEALLAAVVAVVWTRRRLGRWQAWLTGVPLVAAVVWAVTETAARLLPNLL